MEPSGTAHAAPMTVQQQICKSTRAAASWAFEHTHHFSPFDESDLYEPSRLKAFIEFAIMTAVYDRLNDSPSNDPRTQAAIQLIDTSSYRDDFTDWILRHPEILVEFTELAGVLREVGRPNPQLVAKIGSAICAGALDQIERLPHRALEVACVHEWAGIEAGKYPAPGILMATTILNKDLRTPWICRDTAYAITHVIMFAHRFGLVRNRSYPLLSTIRTRSILADMLVIMSAEGDWDILGEVLLCWKCVGLAATPLTSSAWRAFLSAQQEDGSFLPRRAASSETDGSDQPKLDQIQLRYHTTFVAVLAGTVWCDEQR